jgi:pyridine nucleotide-disulfide oxidoreductase family protein
MTRLLLLGAGHAHAQVLHSWAQQPVPGVELLVVSPSALAPYSGMVPGWLAGSYRFDEICIDFARLCQAAGAQWIGDELVALDPDARRATLASGLVLDFDLLSLNIGSTLLPPDDLGAPVLALRPLGSLHVAWQALLARHATDTSSSPLRLMAVGGGAAGFESLLAARTRLQALRPQRPVQISLVSRGASLLPGLAPGAVRAAQRVLARAAAQVQLNTACTPALAAGQDLLLWATGAQAHAWQRDPARRGGLAVDAAGFIRVDAQLRSVSHPHVWAVGDCAAFAPALPKAGVFAVRMGPVLTAQLRAALGREAKAAPYLPQRRFLVLLATGDGRAIASRGPLWASGRWVWRWKDHIDRSFLARFRPAGSTGQA